MDKELTKTITALCNLITRKVENDSYTNHEEISELTKALAELVTAKAKVFEA